MSLLRCLAASEELSPFTGFTSTKASTSRRSPRLARLRRCLAASEELSPFTGFTSTKASTSRRSPRHARLRRYLAASEALSEVENASQQPQACAYSLRPRPSPPPPPRPRLLLLLPTLLLLLLLLLLLQILGFPHARLCPHAQRTQVHKLVSTKTHSIAGCMRTHTQQ